MSNERPPTREPKAGKMLVVDDDSLVLNSCVRIFTDEGYEVITADNPKDGLDLASQSAFDVILCDWKMPSMSGDAVVKILNERDPETPILMITGYPALERAIAAFKRGAMDYIAKPFTPEEISDAVRQAIGRRKKSRAP